MPSADSLKRRLAPVSALLVTFIALAAQLVGALLPSVPLFAAAAAAGLALDLAISYRRPGLLSTLNKANITVTVRQLIRDTLTLLLLLRVMGDDALLGGGSPIVVGLLLAYLAHSVCQTVAVQVRRSRWLPIVTRNIDTSALLVTFIALAAQLVGGLLPSVPLFAAAAAAGLALDLAISYRRPGLLSTLSRANITVTVRQLLRDTLTLLLLLRVMGDDALLGGGSPIVVGLLLVYLAHSACQTVAVQVRRSRVLPIVTRNIDTSALRLSAAPPAILVRRADLQLLGISVPATAGLLATAVTRDTTWGLLGLALAVAFATAGTTYLSSWLTGRKRAPRDEAVLEWFAGWLAAYRPTVGLYFSGGQASAYQANMWLSTVAELDGRPVIVLRERYMVQQIEATDIPIVCIPKLSNLMTLEHSTLKVLLHPANAGKTSQALRIPSIKQAFINHGESDKLSSCNPYARAYDEVWVAGPAARERYALADVGVEDKDVVEVGRPQLASILPFAGAPEGDWTTVLYAPTWEGWTDDPVNTSLILAGKNIVRELLADPRVRLFYKPHPFTGDVDPRAGRANQRVMAMIAEANAARAAEWGGERPDAAAQQLLRRRTEELDMLLAAGFRSSADELERMMLQGTPGAGHAAAVEQAVAAWEDAYWA
ncbi:MAG: hypothetical protein ACRDO0_13405, partial [Nocardioidaceae bacterium]